MLGVGDPPEVPGVPFVQPLRDPVGVLGQQRLLVGSVAMRPLPAGDLHEVAAQLLFPQIEGAAPQVPALGVGLPVVDGRIVDLERRLVATVVDEGLGLLNRIVAGVVDAVMVELGPAVGHPVRNELARSGSVLDPDGDAVPQAAHIWGPFF